jgi:zinc transport system substrate-binding protein
MRAPIAAAVALACVAALAAGCGRAEEPAGGPAEAAAIRAFVTILPQVTFVEAVGGERVHAQALVRPGQSPHAYDPTPRQMARLAEADLYFLIGVPFEEILRERIQSVSPDMKMVDTGRGIHLRTMEESHQEHAEHDHGRKDPHVWLDPNNVMTMARSIADALVELDPEHEAEYRRNLEQFIRELEELDEQIQRRCRNLEKRQFMVYHPAFGYFADAYGLEQIPIEIEGKSPSASDLAELIETARRLDIRAIFVQKQFSSEAAEAVAEEIGGQVVRVDPLARDYMANMRTMADAFAGAMK